ncbi:MAG: efflux RND transporter periplasmic adaptor subunit [Cellvibrio sp.]|uniref:efflux RND transporter periplasmic adaptor subunit n=1 Tax=Cellvibrio sp. TaxID=1965322 RepID=UPI0031B53387
MQTLGNSNSFFRRPAGVATLAIAALVVIWLIWKLLFATDENEVVLTTESVVRGDIENLVTATGTLQPQDYVDVGAQVSGQLEKLHVEVGSEVKAGDLLAEIDATVYAAKVDATRAQLQNQKAQLLDREAQLKLAEINYKREQNLFAEDATTSESLETADANLKSSRAQLKSLQAQIEQIESTLRVEAANLNYAKIYAPIDGTVVSITSRQGQTLNTNQQAPTVMRVADLSTMTVQTQVSEADIGKLRKDMSVYFTTLGSQGRRWYSKLDRIWPTPEILNNVVLYNALFDVPNESRLLMTQMSTQVFFVESQAKDALLVPMSAVSFAPPRGMRPQGGPQVDGEKSTSLQSDKPAAANEKPVADRPQNGTAPDGARTRPEMANGNRPSGEWRQRRENNMQGQGATGNQPRPAIVKVMNEKGDIEERKVVVGVTNRVQAQILEGLKEGEKVVSGSSKPNQVKVAPAGGFGGPGMGRR